MCAHTILCGKLNKSKNIKKEKGYRIRGRRGGLAHTHTHKHTRGQNAGSHHKMAATKRKMGTSKTKSQFEKRRRRWGGGKNRGIPFKDDPVRK